MSIVDAVIRTVACNAPECGKVVMFDRTQEKETFENPANVWLKSTRVVQSADGRNLVYCSDTCEIKGVATGTHNIPEPPKIITQGNAAAVAAAAQAAAQKAQTDAALRDGQSTKIQLSE